MSKRQSSKKKFVPLQLDQAKDQAKDQVKDQAKDQSRYQVRDQYTSTNVFSNLLAQDTQNKEYLEKIRQCVVDKTTKYKQQLDDLLDSVYFYHVETGSGTRYCEYRLITKEMRELLKKSANQRSNKS